MRTIVRWCLDRSSVVVLATILIVVAGLIGATQLRQQFFPDLNFPLVAVTVPVTGLDAQSVDQQVSQPIGQKLRSIDGADKVFEVATGTEARVYMQLAFGSDTDAAKTQVEKQIAALDLPAAAGTPKFEGNFTDQAVLAVSIAAKDGDVGALTDTVKKYQSRIEKLDGVNHVEVDGGVASQFTVTLKPAALAGGISPALVAGALRTAQLRAPAGVSLVDGAAVPVLVEAPGLPGGTTALAALPLGNGQVLGDVATVTKTADPTAGLAYTNGKPSVTLQVFRNAKADEVKVVDAADKELEGARRELGKRNVVTLFATAPEVRKSIKGLLEEGLLGALFAVIVIYLFLRSVRPTLIAAVSIPTSIVFGLLAAWWLGLTLNIITLAGLTIAIGRVIDDGIVVIENIFKHLERGDDRRTAVMAGTSEVALAIAASTLATAAVFLPIGFVGGFVSEIFLSFSIIVTCALLASFIVAVTVVPVLAGLFLRPPATEPQEPRLKRWVTPATRFGVKHRWIVIPAALVTFAATIGIVAAGAIPVQFLPDTGTQQVYGTVKLPAGASPEAAARLLAPLRGELDHLPGTKDAQVGSGKAAVDAGNGQIVDAAFFLTLDDTADADKAVTRIRSWGAKHYAAGFTVQRLENGPPSGAFQAQVNGTTQAQVAAASAKITKYLKSQKDVVEVASDAVAQQPQLVARLRPTAAAVLAGPQVAGTIAAATAPQPAGTTLDGDPIVVRSDPAATGTPAALEALPLSLASTLGAGSAASATGSSPTGAGGGGLAASTDAGGPGSPVPAGAEGLGAPATPAGATNPPSSASARVGDVATVSLQQQPAVISRIDGKLDAQVSARLLGSDTNGTTKQLKAGIAKLDLGGATVGYEGDAAFIAAMFRDLGIAMLTAIILVYLVLVVFFGSLRQPITILAPVLFSTIGSLLALALTGRALGLPAMIGQLLLIGIVVANSILLVDTAIRQRKRGLPRDEALIEAARERVRPVLMTATATIASLVPLALGISGEGGIISKSLGTVVIGGLITATLLTLVIVPAVFTLFDRRKGPLPGTTPDDVPPTTGNGNGTGGRHDVEPAAATAR